MSWRTVHNTVMGKQDATLTTEDWTGQQIRTGNNDYLGDSECGMAVGARWTGLCVRNS